MTSKNAPRVEAERLEEDVLYTEKAHFGMATVWNRAHLLLGIASTIAAAVAGLKASTNPLLTTVLAFLSAALTGLITFLDPAKQGQLHHAAGIRYNALRGELRRFREIDLAKEQDLPPALRDMLETFAKKKTDIMSSSPHTGGLAYFVAKRSIERKEHAYATQPTSKS